VTALRQWCAGRLFAVFAWVLRHVLSMRVAAVIVHADGYGVVGDLSYGDALQAFRYGVMQMRAEIFGESNEATKCGAQHGEDS
jgi:hypothetical protein